MIDQPTVVIPFVSATTFPTETLTFDYSRDRVVLGIQCEETEGAGIRIAGVVEGTAAEQAGLRSGDIITYANAVAINSCSDMQELLDSKSPGDRIVIKVHRPERVFLIMVELEE
jgi:S1-C subfamily serine protease